MEQLTYHTSSPDSPCLRIAGNPTRGLAAATVWLCPIPSLQLPASLFFSDLSLIFAALNPTTKFKKELINHLGQFDTAS